MIWHVWCDHSIRYVTDDVNTTLVQFYSFRRNSLGFRNQKAHCLQLDGMSFSQNYLEIFTDD